MAEGGEVGGALRGAGLAARPLRAWEKAHFSKMMVAQQRGFAETDGRALGEVGIRVDDLQQSSVGDALAGGAGQLLAEAAGQRGPGAAPGLRVAAAAVVGVHGRGAEAEGLQPFNFVQVRRLAPDGAVEVSGAARRALRLMNGMNFKEKNVSPCSVQTSLTR